MKEESLENWLTDLAYLESLIFSVRECKELDKESQREISVFTKEVLKHD